MADLATILDWARTNSTMLWLLSTVSVVTFVGTLAAIPFIVAHIPEDYFMREGGSTLDHYVSHPTLRHVFLIVRNIVGIVFIMAGIVMLFTPGQGIITILIGILLTTFSGKRNLVLRMMRQKNVLDTLNWMRAKSHKPPLQIPPQ